MPVRARARGVVGDGTIVPVAGNWAAARAGNAPQARYKRGTATAQRSNEGGAVAGGRLPAARSWNYRRGTYAARRIFVLEPLSSLSLNLFFGALNGHPSSHERTDVDLCLSQASLGARGIPPVGSAQGRV